MKNVLVVSDNVDLVTHFQKVTSLQRGIVRFDYMYSVINKSPENLIELSMSEADMKDELFINTVIEKYDLVISAHCKQIFPKKLVESVRCINIHPGLNPHNRGWYPQVFSIVNKKPIGCTIHLMDTEIDHGGIIYQSEVFISDSDTSFDVYEKVVQAEKELISSKLRKLVDCDYEVREPVSNGNYNGIADFKELCELKLNHVGTLREHIDLLRALTHGDFCNAFYSESEGSSKTYVKLMLIKDEK